MSKLLHKENMGQKNQYVIKQTINVKKHLVFSNIKMIFDSFANIMFKIIFWKGNGSHGFLFALPLHNFVANAYCSLNLLGQQQSIPLKKA